MLSLDVHCFKWACVIDSAFVLLCVFMLHAVCVCSPGCRTNFPPGDNKMKVRVDWRVWTEMAFSCGHFLEEGWWTSKQKSWRKYCTTSITRPFVPYTYGTFGSNWRSNIKILNTLACGQEEPEIKPPALWLPANLFYTLYHLLYACKVFLGAAQYVCNYVQEGLHEFSFAFALTLCLRLSTRLHICACAVTLIMCRQMGREQQRRTVSRGFWWPSSKRRTETHTGCWKK